MTKTRMFKEGEVKRSFYLIDAKDKILGRLAAKVAAILRGKHKASFTPHIDSGDTVIIINAEKIKVTGKKMFEKEYHRYSGYPSGNKTVIYEDMMAKHPTEILRLAITRMIPTGPLGYRIKQRVKIYAGDKHPHQAQLPTPLEVK